MRKCDECGEETTQPPGVNCDFCTGEVRVRCGSCGRTDLAWLRVYFAVGADGLTPVSYRHSRPAGGRCEGSTYEIQILN